MKKCLHGMCQVIQSRHKHEGSVNVTLQSLPLVPFIEKIPLLSSIIVMSSIVYFNAFDLLSKKCETIVFALSCK